MTVHRATTVLMAFGLSWLIMPCTSEAHDPVFGLGPHTIFQDGVELTPDFTTRQAGDTRSRELAFIMGYGLTADWTIGADLPWLSQRMHGNTSRGGGDLRLWTKYRFWRRDAPGVQESASLFFKLKPDTAASSRQLSPGTGGTDWIAGAAYGFESLTWYRWAALRLRRNGRDDGGLKRGNVLLADLAIGYRFTPPSYYKPDLVWMVELNGEFTRQSRQGGAILPDTGGDALFASPGLMWTLRNYAIKAGVQLPVHSRMNWAQPKPDYRARLVLEWHL